MHFNTKNISGKVIFITGGSSGLGEATARHLAARGAKLAIAARRMEKLAKIAADIEAAGGDALALKLDVTDAQAVKLAAEKAARHFGRLDVMMNNAGCLSTAPLRECRIEDWSRMIDTNIKGVLHGIAAALPIFEKQGNGHFINLSSVAGLKVLAPRSTVYSATKFAVRAISEGLRQEVGAKIRVTALEPGLVQSEIFANGAEANEESRALMADLYKAAIPAEAVARAVAYAIEQPADVDINEIVLRPTSEEF